MNPSPPRATPQERLRERQYFEEQLTLLQTQNTIQMSKASNGSRSDDTSSDPTQRRMQVLRDNDNDNDNNGEDEDVDLRTPARSSANNDNGGAGGNSFLGGSPSVGDRSREGERSGRTEWRLIPLKLDTQCNGMLKSIHKLNYRSIH